LSNLMLAFSERMLHHLHEPYSAILKMETVSLSETLEKPTTPHGVETQKAITLSVLLKKYRDISVSRFLKPCSAISRCDAFPHMTLLKGTCCYRHD